MEQSTNSTWLVDIYPNVELILLDFVMFYL